MDYAVHALICCVICAFGSLVGAGGGFLMMPIFILFYMGKDFGGASLTATKQLHFMSVFAVMVNGLASTYNYGRLGRIDYKTGLILGCCAAPAGFLMQWVMEITSTARPDSFSVIFGVFLFAIAAFIFWRVSHLKRKGPKWVEPKLKWTRRKMTDGTGNEFEWAFNIQVGACVATFEGGLAGFFGVGGGFLRVPVMTQLLHFPAHVAAATSMFVLVITVAAVLTKAVWSDLATGAESVLPYGLAFAGGAGAFFGAQIGTRLSKKIHAEKLIVLVAFALILGGILLILKTCS
jgi:uncharacterized protein